MFQIEWKSSHYHSDGRKRSRPKASTVHGWLVKWRATFSGNESLRKKGIAEMREAKAVRERKKERKAARRSKKGAKSPLGLSFFFFGKEKKRSHRSDTRHRSSKHATRSAVSRRVASPTQSPRPSRHHHYRPSGSRHSSRGYSRRSSSRQTSYNSGKSLVRTGSLMRTK
ncbi:hypothetical protein F5J12DRAFT_11443 [Pisolithus orientalis]|uniref:uncharacterized protein n=1 Tax=Pisolithus orientalis TaxID=936130 RepID=UPI002225AEA2|nr:uncharacterized protein F5J12DRAFT_11443 [Pisolithus orientalis]KAI6035091.1 hypothetical protein F5J12DRAFT_11443 [Pisolithus orientalis]